MSQPHAPADVFKRFVLKPDRVTPGSNGAPASGLRGRLAKAMLAGTSKARISGGRVVL